MNKLLAPFKILLCESHSEPSTASRLTKELTGGIQIEQRCVGSDLPLAGGKTKIPERYQEQMCGLLTLRLYIMALP